MFYDGKSKDFYRNNFKKTLTFDQASKCEVIYK